MKGDIIQIEQSSYQIADEIIGQILPEILSNNNVYCISVAGESGSGKSVTAFALHESLGKKNVKSIVIQQDDYFFLPPKTNELNRRKSLTNVGPKEEVNLELIDEQLQQIKQGYTAITKPLVHFNENKIELETISVEGIKVLIIEGTYTSLLKNIDKRIFIDRDFNSTIMSIKKRARDVVDSFLLDVLQIEHNIISKHKQLCTIIVKEGFTVEFLN